MKSVLYSLSAAIFLAASTITPTFAQTAAPGKSALILIEYQNDWMAATGGINAQFKDRKQFDDSVANSKLVIAEARRRHMEVIYVTMTLEPSYKVLGQAKYGLRALMPKYKSFLGEQASFFPGFEPAQGEYVIRERTGSSAFAGTSLDSYLRNNHIEEIYLSGYSLRQCVESTLRNAHDLGYNTNVIYDASAAFTKEQQTSFLMDIVPFYGNAMTTQEFLKLRN
ncbi:cysteine hydrolase family protein [Herbaspirillum frisingense]|uniref:cysteine hydrolase n=1 Tax=Herbaspirillum frisingense TaxID=92645 RepID=UPI001602A48B|nr:cysteine hydrolase family protein [Herbaspirillum frisingense]QNB05865.1 cysteine hydrolase family protein [Herbaspirillum frisingense]